MRLLPRTHSYREIGCHLIGYLNCILREEQKRVCSGESDSFLHRFIHANLNTNVVAGDISVHRLQGCSFLL